MTKGNDQSSNAGTAFEDLELDDGVLSHFEFAEYEEDEYQSAKDYEADYTG